MKRNNESVNIRDIIYIVIAVAACILLYGIIGCPIKAVTGVSCAGCGMTRALLAAGKGHVREAFDYHPLFWTVPICAVIYLLRARIPKKLLNILCTILIILFLTVYVIRIFDPSCTIVTVEINKGLIYRLFHIIYEHHHF